MGRYSTPGIFFFSPTDLSAALQGGASRPLESLQATARLGEIGTFEATYPYPRNHGSGYVAFGLLEAVGNIAVILYDDFNYPAGAPRAKMFGECYIIDNVKVEDRQAGGTQVRLTGRSFLSELESKQAWEPIGDSTNYNTTLTATIDEPNGSNSVGEKSTGDTEITVANAGGFSETDMVSIPILGGGTFIGLITEVDGGTLKLDRPFPGIIATNTTVTRYIRRLSVQNSTGFETGAKVTITLNSGTFTSIIEEGVTAGNGGGSRILLRDGVSGKANSGNAVVAINRSKPTTTPYDDIAQILANAPGWTSDNTYLPETPGTSHVPDGASVYELLKTVSDIQDVPFRLEIDPLNRYPLRKIKWGIIDPVDSGIYINLEAPPPGFLTTTHMAQGDRGTVHGTISREYRDNRVTRIYPVGGDPGVTLMGVSKPVRDALAASGIIIVDDRATLGLYEPPYMYNSNLEPGQVIARRVTFSDVSAETIGASTWPYACDRLAWLSARWLLEHRRAYWEWRVSSVDVSSSDIPRVGTYYGITQYFDGQTTKVPSGSYTRDTTNNLIAREITMRWDIERQIPLYDFVLSDAAHDPTDAAPSLASQFRTYDMVARKLGRGNVDRTATIAYTAPTQPGGAGVYLPLAGGTMTGNISFSGSQTVDGVDISAHAADPSAHHAPVTAGNTAISVTGQAVSAAVNETGGLEIDSGLRLMLPGDSGLGRDGTGVYLSPSTLTAATTNGVSGSAHTHAVTAADDTVNAGAATLLKSTATGGLSVDKLGVGVAGEAAAALTVKARADANYGLWLKQRSGQTHDMWRVDDASANPLLRLTGVGHLESGTPAFVSGQVGWRISNTGNAEFNDVRVRGELHASVFAVDETTAVGGSMLVKTAGKVGRPRPGQPNDNVLPAINGTFTLIAEASPVTGFNYFPATTILLFRMVGLGTGGDAIVTQFYLQVQSVGSVIDGNQVVYPLTCIRRWGGTTGFIIPAGSPIIKWTELIH